MTTFEIKNRWNGSVQFSCELSIEFDNESYGIKLGAAVKMAISSHADLTHAGLRWADLTHADLTHAVLTHADLRWADLIHADLTHADLTHADLTHADLRWADLIHADLTHADLTHADLRWAIGNQNEIKSLQCEIWKIAFTADVMAIGCQQHKISEWFEFTDEQIAKMENRALTWWKRWKPILMAIMEKR